LEAFANNGGLIPEQIWDSGDIPDKELYFGRPSGSAMPLVWAHAEYVKLLRSLQDNRVFDMPPQTVQRYQVEKTGTQFGLWQFNHKLRSLLAGRTLRVEALAAGVVHWSVDGWTTSQNMQMQDSHLGIYFADLPTKELPAGRKVEFTFYWPLSDRWEDQNFEVLII
jgi:glucoamylase